MLGCSLRPAFLLCITLVCRWKSPNTKVRCAKLIDLANLLMHHNEVNKQPFVFIRCLGHPGGRTLFVFCVRMMKTAKVGQNRLSKARTSIFFSNIEEKLLRHSKSAYQTASEKSAWSEPLRQSLKRGHLSVHPPSPGPLGSTHARGPGNGGIQVTHTHTHTHTHLHKHTHTHTYTAGHPGRHCTEAAPARRDAFQSL